MERVPKDWARGLILPLYKNGDARIPDNYRGITRLSMVGLQRYYSPQRGREDLYICIEFAGD